MENQLIMIVGGVATIDKKVECMLDDYVKAKEDADYKEKQFRSSLLNAMIDNKIISAKVGKYTLTQVMPKDTVTFDTDKFIANESLEVSSQFSAIKDTESFDIEKLKEDYPEIYKRCCKADTEVSVNLVALKKALPGVYDKYTTITLSKSPVTLRITQPKSKS